MYLSRLFYLDLDRNANPIIFILILLTVSIISINLLLVSDAHIVGKNIQQWQSVQNNLEIQFTYEPKIPIIDTFTELKFSIQNISNGEHVENLTGRVVVTNGQRLFKFENINIPTGHFSVRYIFPDDGNHQVLLRLDRGNDFKIPASFNIFVPHQPAPSILDPFPSTPGTSSNDPGILLSKILTVLLPVSAITALVIILKKKPKKGSE